MSPTTEQIVAGMIGKFVGPRKIASVEVLEQKTLAGKSVVSVKYEGDYDEKLTLKTLILSVTDDAKDFNSLREKKFMAILPELMQILAEYDIKVYEVDALFRDAANTLTQSFNRALSFLWYGSPKNFVVGSDPVDHFTLLEAQEVIARIPEAAAKEEKDNATETPANANDTDGAAS